MIGRIARRVGWTLLHFAKTIAVTLTFVGALVAGLYLHVNLPIARRLATAEVDAALRGAGIKGRIELTGVDRIRLTGADGLGARVIDPEGIEVLAAQGMGAKIAVGSLVRSLLFGKGDVDIHLSRATVDHADVNLDLAADGDLRLAHAFEPQQSTPAGGGGRGVRVALDEVRVTHAWIHGLVGGAPRIDVDAVELHSGVLLENQRLSVDLGHVECAARALPRGTRAEGVLQGHFVMPSKSGRNLGGDVAFDGVVATIPVKARASVDGTEVQGSVDVPRLDASAVRPIAPEVPLFRDLGLYVEAHGMLPKIDVTARLTSGDARFDAKGALTLGDAPAGEMEIHADQVDLRAFDEGAPPTRLRGVVRATFARSLDGSLKGTASLDSDPGMVGANVAPPLTLRGDFESKGMARPTFHAVGRVNEAGAPTEVVVDLRPVGSSYDLDFSAATTAPALDRVRRVALPEGSARFESKGTVSFGSGRLAATLGGEADGVTRGAVRVEHASWDAEASGTLRDPRLEATARVDGLHLGPLAFEHAELHDEGPLASQAITLGMKGADHSPNVEVHGDLSLGATATLRDVRATVWRDDVSLVVDVESATIADNNLRFERVSVQGLGEPLRGGLAFTPSSVVVQAISDGIDLGRAARLLNLTDWVQGGQLVVNADLDARKDGADGQLTLELMQGSLAHVNDVSAQVVARMTGRRIEGSAHAAFGKIGTIDAKQGVVEIGGGGPLSGDSWRRAFGSLTLISTVDLGRLAALVPEPDLPFDKIAGEVYVEATTARHSETDYTPEVKVSARTHGLVVEGGSAKKAPWRSSDLDVQLDVNVDGESGFAELAARLADAKGNLASLDAKSNAIPFSAMLTGADGLMDRLEETPVAAELTVPRRRLADLPPVLEAFRAEGEAEAAVEMQGSLREPRVKVVAHGIAVRAVVNRSAIPLSMDCTGEYDGARGTASIAARAPDHRVLDASIDLTARSGALFHGGPWRVSAAAHLTGFPLVDVPALAERGIRGAATGTISLRDFNANAQLASKLHLDAVRIGGATYPTGEIAVDTDETSLRASASLRQADGSLEAALAAGLLWGDRPLPAFATSRKIEAALKAKRFRAAALLPLVSTKLTELDGRIDADTRFSLDPVAKSASMQGTATLDDGLIQLASTGQELHRAHAKLTLSPDGLVRLDDVTAYGISGKLMASGVARLDGLRLGEARAAVRIPKGQPIPIDVDGSEVGEVDGDWNVVATSSPGRLNLDVQAHSMHVSLPLASSHAVLSLDDPENVRVGTYQSRGTVVLPLAADDVQAKEETRASATEVVVAVHLGKDVEVKRGVGLKVALQGNATMTLTDKIKAAGQVQLPRGTLVVQGKRFDIEKGTVSFVDDPSNPEVVVTAGWTAPDGTRVHADFVGPLQTGKVTLRSEPSLPNNEILALIIFGTTEKSSSAPTANGTAGAAASGLATEGISEGLDELTGLDVATRIDTSDSANPRPEVELQVARDISLQVAVVLGTPPPGANPDTTFATFDWRFLRNWSLETTFGDKGSSIADVIWQYRY